MTAMSTLPLEAIFGAANGLALLGWIVLIFGPRTEPVRRGLQGVAVGALAVLYTVLAGLFLFRVEGGGFGSLAAVQRLFAVPEVVLAGWVHYLAFDLLVGTWLARRFDAAGVSRWVQAPLLGTTFMLGPVGWLLGASVLAARRLGPTARSPGRTGSA